MIPVLRMVTIGVYGFDGESFLQRLRHADVRLLLDVRQRRGVRGPEYAWANSRRLQAALVHISTTERWLRRVHGAGHRTDDPVEETDALPATGT